MHMICTYNTREPMAKIFTRTGYIRIQEKLGALNERCNWLESELRWAQLKLATRTAALPTPWAARERETEAMEGLRREER